MKKKYQKLIIFALSVFLATLVVLKLALYGLSAIYVELTFLYDMPSINNLIILISLSHAFSSTSFYHRGYVSAMKDMEENKKDND